MQLRDAVGALREAQAHDRHVEGLRGAAGVVLGAERQHVGDVDARQQVGREVALDQRGVEAVDAGRDRGVGREDGAGAHHLERLGEGQPVTDQVADALEPEEAGVPLVGVEDLRFAGAGEVGVQLDGADAADAEQQLLQQAVLAAAAVQPVGDAAQLFVVLGMSVSSSSSRTRPTASCQTRAYRALPSGSASTTCAAEPSGWRSTLSGRPSGSSTG